MIVWRRAKVDLERDGVFGTNSGFHVVMRTRFPLGVVGVFRERVENNRLVEEEAPNWI